MSRQQTTAGYSDWIWIPYFRRCWVSADRVELTHPIIFGRGFLFDRARQVVTIRRCLLGLPLSKQEIPLSDVTISLGSRYYKPTSGYYTGSFWSPGSPGGTQYFIKITTTDGREIKVFGREGFGKSKRLKRILAAIEQLGI